MRKILYISGTRADYGLMKSVLSQIKKHPKLKIEIIATGMHLMPQFGCTVKDIRKDGFKAVELKAVYKKDNKESMVEFIGNLVKLLSKAIKKIKPDIILLLGDRGEMLAGAIAGAYFRIPIAHIHGGEKSLTVDESVRHSITKLANLHFVATKDSAKRIIKMGENRRRVFKVGAPGLDNILEKDNFKEKKIINKYKINIKKPILLVVQHPAEGKKGESAKQIKETMEAIKELAFQSIVIYPNADSGGREMINVIKQYRKYSFINIYKNIVREDYLSLMRISSAMIGNSSSGIIEAPSFKLPVVNIGERQDKRERANNIIDVNYNKKQIKKAIKKVIYDKSFQKKLKKCKNTYGDGKAGKRIVDILFKIKIDKKLLEKQINY